MKSIIVTLQGLRQNKKRLTKQSGYSQAGNPAEEKVGLEPQSYHILEQTKSQSIQNVLSKNAGEK